MSTQRPRRGRPEGLTGLRLNPDALDAFMGDRPARHVAHDAGISPAHMSQMRGGHFASPDVAIRLADALAVKPGALFPELSPVLPARDRRRYGFVVAEVEVA